MRLGQVHRAGPLARRSAWAGRAPSARRVPWTMQRRDRALRQARIHGEAPCWPTTTNSLTTIASVVRQALAADTRRVAASPIQPPSAYGVEGLLEALRRGDAAVVVARAAFPVADAVQRLQHLLAELRCLAQDRLDHVRRGVGEARQVVVARRSGTRRAGGTARPQPGPCRSAWHTSSAGTRHDGTRSEDSSYLNYLPTCCKVQPRPPIGNSAGEVCQNRPSLTCCLPPMQKVMARQQNLNSPPICALRSAEPLVNPGQRSIGRGDEQSSPLEHQRRRLRRAGGRPGGGAALRPLRRRVAQQRHCRASRGAALSPEELDTEARLEAVTARLQRLSRGEDTRERRRSDSSGDLPFGERRRSDSPMRERPKRAAAEDEETDEAPRASRKAREIAFEKELSLKRCSTRRSPRSSAGPTRRSARPPTRSPTSTNGSKRVARIANAIARCWARSPTGWRRSKRVLCRVRKRILRTDPRCDRPP